MHSWRRRMARSADGVVSAHKIGLGILLVLYFTGTGALIDRCRCSVSWRDVHNAGAGGGNIPTPHLRATAERRVLSKWFRVEQADATSAFALQASLQTCRLVDRRSASVHWQI